MLNKPFFTEIMHAEGIAGFNKLTCNDIERLVQERKIQSAYSHVQNLDEFERLRWGPFCDFETGGQYSGLFRKRILSYEHDSLGELLQTINFYGRTETVEMGLRSDLKDEEIYLSVLEFVEKTLGIDPKKDSPFLAQSFINTRRSLITFVKEWHSAQNTEPRWNPSYAQPLQKEKLYGFIGTDQPEKWLEKLGAAHTFSRKIDDFDDDGTYLSTSRTLESSYLLLPFDGWTLAECFRRGYGTK